MWMDWGFDTKAIGGFNIPNVDWDRFSGSDHFGHGNDPFLIGKPIDNFEPRMRRQRIAAGGNRR